jgi:hypothetical protein
MKNDQRFDAGLGQGRTRKPKAEVRGEDHAPSAETLEILRNIKTEINCGQVMFPKTDLDRVHNNACDRAIKIVENYIEGYGLFQMTRRASSTRTTDTNPADQPDSTTKETK